MSTNAMPQSIGSAKSAPPHAGKKPSYTVNDVCLMGNSFLRYFAENGGKITLQRTDAGVVLTLQGEIGIRKTEKGAMFVPAEPVPVPEVSPVLPDATPPLKISRADPAVCPNCGRVWLPSMYASESFPGSPCDTGDCMG